MATKASSVTHSMKLIFCVTRIAHGNCRKVSDGSKDVVSRQKSAYYGPFDDLSPSLKTKSFDSQGGHFSITKVRLSSGRLVGFVIHR